MFTAVKCIVKDRQVAEVLRLLKPYAAEPPVADPLGTGKNEPVKPATPIGETVADAVAKYINAKRAGDKITAKELNRFVTELGFSERSYSYPLSKAVKSGTLRATKLGGVYEVK